MVARLKTSAVTRASRRSAEKVTDQSGCVVVKARASAAPAAVSRAARNAPPKIRKPAEARAVMRAVWRSSAKGSFASVPRLSGSNVKLALDLSAGFSNSTVTRRLPSTRLWYWSVMRPVAGSSFQSVNPSLVTLATVNMSSPVSTAPLPSVSE